MKALVFEPFASGHRLQFVNNLLPALVSLCGSVTVALAEQAPRSSEFAVHLRPWSDRVRIDPWMPELPRGNLAAARAQASYFAQSIRRSGATQVFVPSADGLSQVLGLNHLMWRIPIPASVECDALLLRGGFAYPQPNRAARLRAELSWALAARAPWSAVHVLDPLVYQRLRERRGGGGARISLMPDPVPAPPAIAREEARRRLGIPEDGRYIACAGLLDERKGIDLLVRAFASSSLPDNDRLLLMGRLSPGVSALCIGECGALMRAGRIIAPDGYMSDEDFSLTMFAADLICTPYPRHIGSASIVIRAAAAERPVLGSDFGWIGYVVPRFGLGRICNVTDPAVFAAALRDSLADAHLFRPTESGQRFVAFHSPDNYRATWTLRLRRQWGLPVSEDQRDWEWVLAGSPSTAPGLAPASLARSILH